jgi:hypothetical protein
MTSTTTTQQLDRQELERDYRFISERADSATQKYGVTSVSLLARRLDQPGQ